MKKLIVGLLSMPTLIAANAAQAQQICFDSKGNPIQCAAVPEISALEGTAALATLAAIVLLAWERRRRAA